MCRLRTTRSRWPLQLRLPSLPPRPSWRTKTEPCHAPGCPHTPALRVTPNASRLNWRVRDSFYVYCVSARAEGSLTRSLVIVVVWALLRIRYYTLLTVAGRASPLRGLPRCGYGCPRPWHWSAVRADRVEEWRGREQGTAALACLQRLIGAGGPGRWLRLWRRPQRQGRAAGLRRQWRHAVRRGVEGGRC